MKTLVFTVILFLNLDFAIASECSGYLRLQHTSKPNLDLIQNPFLFNIQRVPVAHVGVPQITQNVSTTLGEVILRRTALEELNATIADYKHDAPNMAYYINRVFLGLNKPGFNDPGFLNWLQKSYEYALNLRSIYFSGPTVKLKPNFSSAKRPDQIESTEIMAAQRTARSIGIFAPLMFKVNRESIGRPSEWLAKDEQIWIFRILMREPIIRRLLLKKTFFNETNATRINEAVMFLSAFPELFSLASKIEDLGFKFSSYFLTDGYFTESEVLKIGENDGYPIMSSLVIQKKFKDLDESSHSYIHIDGYGFHDMSELQIEIFKYRLNNEWGKFKDQFQDRFDLKNTNLVIESEGRMTITIDADDNTEVSALFYLHLLKQKMSFVF